MNVSIWETQKWLNIWIEILEQWPSVATNNLSYLHFLDKNFVSSVLVSLMLGLQAPLKVKNNYLTFASLKPFENILKKTKICIKLNYK